MVKEKNYKIKKLYFNVKLSLILLIIFSIIFLEKKTLAKGDLTRLPPVEVEVLMKGKKGSVHYFEPSVLRFETGKLYKLEIKNISDSKHYFTSSDFVNSIFTRKVQVIKGKEKIAEIKGNIKEVEVFPKNIVEWWFVPLKTGTFKDLFCKVFDKKSRKTHKEMGMVGTIIIE
tara:strand:- start:561 stop:1076 length:516 start_codon:yes stop_codon:yes gene_type:complete